MSIQALAQQLQSQGRGGDTVLAHITPEEAQLLKARGGSGTVNPETGLPEFGFFSDLWRGFKKAIKKIAPIIMPAIAIFAPALIPAVGTWLGASAATASVVGAAALSAGVTLAAGGDLKQVLTSAALAGATTFITPIVGNALSGAISSVTGTALSAGTTSLIGSAAISGGMAAIRGGSLKQVLAAAATGAASNYLTNLASQAVAKVNSAMASGDIKTVSQKGVDDAVFVAADAANLKAAGLSEAQIAATLKATGVNSIVADTAAAGVSQGKSADIVAFNIAAANPNGVYGTDKTGQTQSITAGNNLESLQRAEDALLIAEDATQLRAQGLSAAQIKETLMATGVSEAVATTAANTVGTTRSGTVQTGAALANTLQTTYANTGKNLFGSTENVVGRDLGEAMTAEQTEAYRALPYKASIDSGAITAADANVLKANGYTPEQVVALTTAGYSGADLVDLASTGVTAATLTTMSNTKIPEGSINDLFRAGASANDIASVSKNLIDTGKLSVASATNILARDFDYATINGLVSKGINVDNVARSGLSANTINTINGNGVNLNNVLNAIENGKYTADSVNNLATSRNFTGLQAASTAGAVTAVKPGGNAATTGSTTTTTTPVDPYAGVVNSGTVTSSEASVLRANGYTANDITNLTRLGYSGADLVDMASTGVTASTLTSMANTQFAESQINDLFAAGASANDISTASNLVNANKLSLNTAEKLLFKDLDSRTITSLTNRGTADLAANSTLSKTTLTNIASNTTLDLGKIAALQAAGTDVESLLAKNDIAGVNRLIANTPIVRDASGQYRVTTMDEFNQQFKAQSSGVLAEDLKFIAQDAANLRAQGLSQAQIKAVLMADGASDAAAQYASVFANQGYDPSGIEQQLRGRNITAVYPTTTTTTAGTGTTTTDTTGGTTGTTTTAGTGTTGTTTTDTGTTTGAVAPFSVAGGTNVQLANGSTGIYDPATGITYNTDGSIADLGFSAQPGAGTDVAGPATGQVDRTAPGVAVGGSNLSLETDSYGYRIPAGTTYQNGLTYQGNGRWTMANGRTMIVGSGGWDDPSVSALDPNKSYVTKFGTFGTADTGTTGAGGSDSGTGQGAGGTTTEATGTGTGTPGTEGTGAGGPGTGTDGTGTGAGTTGTAQGAGTDTYTPGSGDATTGSGTDTGTTTTARPDWLPADAVSVTLPDGQPGYTWGSQVTDLLGRYQGTPAGVFGTITPIIPGGSTPGVVTGPATPTTTTGTTGGTTTGTTTTDTTGTGGVIGGTTGTTTANTVTGGTTTTTDNTTANTVTGGTTTTVGNVVTGGNAVVGGNVVTGGNTVVGGNAVVDTGNVTTGGTGAVVPTDSTGNVITTVLTPIVPGGNTGGSNVAVTGGNTVTTGGNVIITSTGNVVGTGGNASVVGNVAGTGNVLGNISTGGNAVVVGNIGGTGGNVAGNVLGNTTGNVTGNVITIGTGGNVLGNIGGTGGNVTGNITGNTLGNVTGNITGNTLGNVTGNITGNTTGNVTGNVVGNTTGNVTGNTSVTGNVIIPITPIIPTDPWTPTPFTPLTFKTLPDLKLPGLNPGFIAPEPYYQNTNQVQSRYYWGSHPYQPGPTFNQALYNQVPAPVTPWGLQQMYTPTDLAKYFADQQVTGPVVPR